MANKRECIAFRIAGKIRESAFLRAADPHRQRALPPKADFITGAHGRGRADQFHRQGFDAKRESGLQGFNFHGAYLQAATCKARHEMRNPFCLLGFLRAAPLQWGAVF
jgi:hypothetical protein